VLVTGIQPEAAINLYIIVVLYQRSISASATCQALLRQVALSSQDIILVYDNSPISNLGPIPDSWNVVIDADNGGLAKAYNYAISEAKSANCRWVLLLDQDSELPGDFLSSTHESLSVTDFNHDIVAVVPIVKCGNRQISPMIPLLGREIPFKMQNVVESKWLTAINSGTCLRVDFIEGVGGFCKDFWLDYLDYWLFKIINNNGKSVYVTHDVLQHDLSVANMNNGISEERYNNVLTAERQFTNKFLPPLSRLVLVPRLVVRGLKHLILTKDKRLSYLMVRSAASQSLTLLRSFRPRPPGISGTR
jgi:GT2 family glycosyltransferase